MGNVVPACCVKDEKELKDAMKEAKEKAAGNGEMLTAPVKAEEVTPPGADAPPATDLTPEEATNFARGFLEKMETLLAAAKSSPLRKIAVENALEVYHQASSSRNGTFNEGEFVETTVMVATANGVPADDTISAHAKEVFSSLDADGNGELRLGEWASGVPLFFHCGGRKADAMVFKILDADGNGFLSFDELQEYLLPLVNALVPKSHTNGLKLRKQLQMELSGKVFGEVDQNNDGKLSPEEFNNWAKKNRITTVVVDLLKEKAASAKAG